MCVYRYARIHVCVHTYTCMYVRIMRTYLCACVYIRVYAYTSKDVCAGAHACIHVIMHVHVHVCMGIYLHVCLYGCMHIVYICMVACICVCIYVYMCMGGCASVCMYTHVPCMHVCVCTHVCMYALSNCISFTFSHSSFHSSCAWLMVLHSTCKTIK